MGVKLRKGVTLTSGDSPSRKGVSLATPFFLIVDSEVRGTTLQKLIVESEEGSAFYSDLNERKSLFKEILSDSKPAMDLQPPCFR